MRREWLQRKWMTKEHYGEPLQIQKKKMRRQSKPGLCWLPICWIWECRETGGGCWLRDGTSSGRWVGAATVENSVKGLQRIKHGATVRPENSTSGRRRSEGNKITVVLTVALSAGAKTRGHPVPVSERTDAQ